MSVLERPAKRFLALVSTTALLVVPWSPVIADSLASEGNSNDKQTICHATNADGNAYVVNTPNKNGDVDGHAADDGPVWTPALKDQHTAWGDIIPPFDYNDHGTPAHFAGLNWDANGQAWFANDCQVPITGSVVKTNDANDDGSFSDDETSAAEGADVPFTVIVTNTSVVPVVVATLLDSVGGSSVAFTPSPDPVGSTLAPGGSVTFTFTVASYSPADGGATTNLMTVGLVDVEDPTNAVLVQSTSTVRTFVANPDVSVVKTGTASVAPGDDITWSLTVTNDGNVALAGVTVTDSLPADTTLVSVGGAGWACAGTTDLSCTLDGSLGVGLSSAVTVVATLSSAFTGTTISNTAVVTPEDSTPDDNTSTATTDVVQPTGGGGGGEFTGGGGGTVITPTLPRTGQATLLTAASALALLLAGLVLVLLADAPGRVRPVRRRR